jgi:hypothetical protein
MSIYQQLITDLPGTLFGILTTLTGFFNSILSKIFGDKLVVYVVMFLALVGGYFLRDAIVKSGKNNYYWFILLSLLIFLSLRYLSIGGG